MTRSVCGDEVSKLVFTCVLILSHSVDTSGEDAAQLLPPWQAVATTRTRLGFSHN